ncbi:MAG: DUF3168 domain-containing protein, partial [Pseudomonadota bacterium]
GGGARARGGVPPAPPPQPQDAASAPPYAVIGDESVQDFSSQDRGGAAHTLGISVFASERSFAQAKQLAGAISDALTGAAPALARGRVVHVHFVSARTRREERDRLRRIDLRFRVLVEDDA